MVVDQPTGLHKGITDCRADKLKAAFFQCFRQRIGGRRRGGNFRQRRSAGHLWRIVDEGPDKISERLAIFFHRQIGAGVADNGLDFSPMANDAGILQESLDIVITHRRHAHRIELVKSLAVVLPFF